MCTGVIWSSPQTTARSFLELAIPIPTAATCVLNHGTSKSILFEFNFKGKQETLKRTAQK